ncbi:MAG: phosphodiester glycosidase family protein [Cyanobacteria bacterium J06598_3]
MGSAIADYLSQRKNENVKMKMPKQFVPIFQVLLPKVLKTAALGVGALAGVLGLSYGACLLKRPPRRAQMRALFQGIRYERLVRESPRPLLFHVVEIDLRAPGIGFLVTPQGQDSAGKDTLADTVPGFLQKNGVQVAINGSFFYPMHVHHAFDYAPRVGEGVNVVGLAISSGERYSAVEDGWAALCIVDAQELSMTEDGDCPENTVHGLAGDRIFIKNGKMVADANRDQLFPRTAIALDAAKETMWLAVVDGRQKGYSEGVTLAELAEVLIEQGADQALNLDGGGSSALAIAEGDSAQVLNAPIQARVPTHQRPVANHLGVFAKPLQSP